jgi:hypothetical protein
MARVLSAFDRMEKKTIGFVVWKSTRSILCQQFKFNIAKKKIANTRPICFQYLIKAPERQFSKPNPLIFNQIFFYFQDDSLSIVVVSGKKRRDNNNNNNT